MYGLSNVRYFRRSDLPKVSADGGTMASLTPVDEGDPGSDSYIMVSHGELSEARATIHALQARLRDQQSCSNQTIMRLKQQLYSTQKAFKQQQVKADRQLNEVMAQLLFLEGRLKKQKIHLRTELTKRDKEIEEQKSLVEKLKNQNEQLLNAIKEICARGGMNGVMRDHSHKNGTNGTKDKGQRGRLGSVKDKFWKNRSSLELNSSDIDRAFQMEANRMYSSHENLHSPGSESKIKSDKKYGESLKSTSPSQMSNGHSRDSGISMSPGDNNQGNGSMTFSDDIIEADDSDRMFVFSSSHINSVIDEEDSVGPMSSGLLSMGSMPMLANISSPVDPGHMMYSAKNRPHSLSSVDLVSIQQEALGDVLLSNSPTPPPSPSYTQVKQESTPFQAFKTMFRRKGSKMKNKKRSVSLSQTTNQEYSEAMKKHFQKYDMT